MGTPEFAVESLKCLVEGGYNVVGVVTMPDKPMGRHQDVLQASPVKQYAVEHGLRVLQPVKLKDEAFVEELRSLRADLQIVVAFRMLPEVVWNMPPMGTFNLHASLLPQYRGAAPINWAVINGETETGITTFFLKHEIDTGEVIQQVRIPIADTDNVGVVHDKLMELGGRLVVETVDHILTDTIRPIPQEEMAVKGPLHPAPKIFKETCRMDWQGRPLKPLYDFVRGLSPYPAAWSEMKDEATGKVYTLKIYETEKEPCVCHEPAGKVVSDGKTYLKVAVDGGYLRLKEIQLTGKKRMRIEDFLRGFRMPENLPHAIESVKRRFNARIVRRRTEKINLRKLKIVRLRLKKSQKKNNALQSCVIPRARRYFSYIFSIIYPFKAKYSRLGFVNHSTGHPSPYMTGSGYQAFVFRPTPRPLRQTPT